MRRLMLADLKSRPVVLVAIAVLAVQARTVFGSQPLEVEELDLGACWLHSATNSARVASFNDGLSFTVIKRMDDLEGILSPPQLNRKITAELRQLGFSSFPESRYDLFLHCSGGGHIFTANLYEGDRPICPWVKGSRSGWQLMNIFSNNNPNPGRMCLGQNPRELIVNARTGVPLGEIEKYLDREYSALIVRIDVLIPERSLVILLNEDERFRERRAKETLEADPTLREMVASIEYNGIVTFVGEAAPILSSLYQFN